MKEVLNTGYGVATQAATLIAEEMSLQDLRQALRPSRRNEWPKPMALARTAFRVSKTQRFAAVHSADLDRGHGRSALTDRRVP